MLVLMMIPLFFTIGGLTWIMAIGGIPVTLLGLVMPVGWKRGVRRQR